MRPKRQKSPQARIFFLVPITMPMPCMRICFADLTSSSSLDHVYFFFCIDYSIAFGVSQTCVEAISAGV
jgi:hypothetical protein